MARHISAPAAEPPSLRPYSLQELLCGARSLEATMRILKLIVGACLLLSLAGCAAYYEPGYGRPYHHYAYRNY
jgi:hypothetical protein